MNIAREVQVPTLAVRMRAHIAIMRLDHSVKQIFILPGIAVAILLSGAPLTLALLGRCLVGMIAVTLVASSNYVLNEMLDAQYDRLHPTKYTRPAACGQVNFSLGYAQWILLAVLGLLLASSISKGLFVSCAVLWGMGCLYNIPPIRTKDVSYLDVLSESVNNPLRFAAGWYMVAAASAITPPVSILVAYWMLGAYFMALKRYSEFRQIGAERAGSYRRSFLHYTEASLLNSVVFYAAASMLFFGAFIMRYRLELVLAFPVIALMMAVYFNLAFEPDSAVQNPEKLYREPKLMILLVICVALLTTLLFVRIPLLAQMFPMSKIP